MARTHTINPKEPHKAHGTYGKADISAASRRSQFHDVLSGEPDLDDSDRLAGGDAKQIQDRPTRGGSAL